MKDHRDAMVSALKEIFIPFLRERGFKGSLPHFHRVFPHRVDYLTVQFYSSGGSFVVEVATAGADGKPHGYGKDLPIEKLNVQYFRDRLRLGSDHGAAIADHWYVFGPRNYDAPEQLHSLEHYLQIAKQVKADFERQVGP